MLLEPRVSRMMSTRDCYYWRVLGTGLSFTVFGIGGLILGLIIFPLVALFSLNQDKRNRRCRLLVHHSFRLFVGLMKHLGVLTYSIHGAEALKGEGMLVVANHPTLIDIVFLISLIPNASCIVKADLFRNVFTRGPVSWAGYIANNAPEELLDDCVAQIQDGANLVVFPEGTRTVPEEALRFKRGAAYIWLRSDCKLALATLSSEPPTLAKNTKWYRVPERRFHYSMTVRTADEPAIAGVMPSSNQDARRVNRLLQDYFQKELTT